MKALTFYELNNAITTILNGDTDYFKKYKSDIEEYLESIKSDLLQDFVYKLYSEYASNIPETVYTRTTYEKNQTVNQNISFDGFEYISSTTYSDNKKEIINNNPNINLELLLNQRMLGFFTYIYKSTKYYENNNLGLNTSDLSSMYSACTEPDNPFFNAIKEDHFNLFLLEELLQTAGLHLLYNNPPSDSKDADFLCRKLMIIRTLNDFYLPLTAYNIADCLIDCDLDKATLLHTVAQKNYCQHITAW